MLLVKHDMISLSCTFLTQHDDKVYKLVRAPEPVPSQQSALVRQLSVSVSMPSDNSLFKEVHLLYHECEF